MTSKTISPGYVYHKVENPKSAVVGYVTYSNPNPTRRRRRLSIIRRLLSAVLEWILLIGLPAIADCARGVFTRENLSAVVDVLGAGSMLLAGAFFTLCILGSILGAINPEAAEAMGAFFNAIGLS